jgi:D-amino-acid dehydrogenase
MAHYIVLGAGIVGACVALALRRDGHEVTLIDRDEPGNGCSFGNAGFIQTATPHPMATPGLLGKLPKLLLDAQSPLSIKWRHAPRLAPWLLQFFRAGTPRRVEEISIAMMALLDRSGAAYNRMLDEARAADLIRRRGLLFVYPDAAAFEAARWEFDLYRRRGVTVDRIGRDQLRQMEPALNPAYADAYFLPETFFTIDPLGLTQRIVERFTRTGGKFVRAEANEIEIGADRPRALHASDGTLDFDALVIAAGVHSARFAARLGDRVMLESARGYHVMIGEPGVELQGPVIDGGMHFGATPMADGLRLAGTLEFASVDAPPDYRRADMLLPMAKRMLPGLSGGVDSRWMGHRPATPDSLPVLGRSTRFENVLYAFGHGQLGLTMAAVTGEVIADIAAGRPMGFDLSPYSVARF